MRALRITQSVIFNLAAFIGGLTVIAVLVCLFLGLRPAIVISGSMEPEIPVGAMTFSRSIPAGQAQVGDVVTLPRPDGTGLVTHRVVENLPGPAGSRMLTLKGDANEGHDPQPYQAIRVGEVRYTVPYLGTVALWMQNNVLLVIGLLILIGGFTALPLGKNLKSQTGQAAPAPPTPAAQPAQPAMETTREMDPVA